MISVVHALRRRMATGSGNPAPPARASWSNGAWRGVEGVPEWRAEVEGTAIQATTTRAAGQAAVGLVAQAAAGPMPSMTAATDDAVGPAGGGGAPLRHGVAEAQTLGLVMPLGVLAACPPGGVDGPAGGGGSPLRHGVAEARTSDLVMSRRDLAARPPASVDSVEDVTEAPVAGGVSAGGARSAIFCSHGSVDLRVGVEPEPGADGAWPEPTPGAPPSPRGERSEPTPPARPRASGRIAAVAARRASATPLETTGARDVAAGAATGRRQQAVRVGRASSVPSTRRSARTPAPSVATAVASGRGLRDFVTARCRRLLQTGAITEVLPPAHLGDVPDDQLGSARAMVLCCGAGASAHLMRAALGAWVVFVTDQDRQGVRAAMVAAGKHTVGIVGDMGIAAVEELLATLRDDLEVIAGEAGPPCRACSTLSPWANLWQQKLLEPAIPTEAAAAARLGRDDAVARAAARLLGGCGGVGIFENIEGWQRTESHDEVLGICSALCGTVCVASTVDWFDERDHARRRSGCRNKHSTFVLMTGVAFSPEFVDGLRVALEQYLRDGGLDPRLARRQALSDRIPRCPAWIDTGYTRGAGRLPIDAHGSDTMRIRSGARINRTPAPSPASPAPVGHGVPLDVEQMWFVVTGGRLPAGYDRCGAALTAGHFARMADYEGLRALLRAVAFCVLPLAQRGALRRAAPAHRAWVRELEALEPDARVARCTARCVARPAHWLSWRGARWRSWQGARPGSPRASMEWILRDAVATSQLEAHLLAGMYVEHAAGRVEMIEVPIGALVAGPHALAAVRDRILVLSGVATAPTRSGVARWRAIQNELYGTTSRSHAVSLRVAARDRGRGASGLAFGLTLQIVGEATDRAGVGPMGGGRVFEIAGGCAAVARAVHGMR